MKSFLSKSRLGWPLAVLIASGCAAQATPDYPGEKLSAVKGVVVNELTETESEEAVVIADWGQVGAMFGGFSSTVAEIEGEFPAQFSLSLYEAPADEALYNPAEGIYWDGDVYPFDPANEPRIALGHILAVGKDAEGNPDPYRVLGGSEEHALLYAEAPIEEGSLGAAMLHATLPAGYHLLVVEELDAEEERAVIECEAESESVEEWLDCGLNSRLQVADPSDEVTVQMAPEGELTFPSYYPIFLTPGTDLDPGPTCNPMIDPMCPTE
jgi:hypothetical protein